MASEYLTTGMVPLKGSKAEMPRFGYGVYQSPAHITKQSVLTALKMGYKHIDTAQFYANEKEVGEAIKESGIPRSEIYVVTKMMRPVNMNIDETLEKMRESVCKIDAGDGNRKGYVDLFLIHIPTSGLEGRITLWKALEKLKEEGSAVDIGVSNFGVEHLRQIEAHSDTLPVNNQIELHPFCQQKEVAEYCRHKGIVITAFAPIARNQRSNDKTLVKIASKHDKEVPQVMIKWLLQKGYIPLPKSDNPDRIKSNKDMDNWTLDDDDMAEIEKLDEGEKGAVCPYNLNCA